MRIAKVLNMQRRSDSEYALVTVRLDDGMEATVLVGGEVEVYFQDGTCRAFVKKGKPKT